MKNTWMMGGMRRVMLLVLAGASVGLVLTDTLTKVQNAVSEIRATYQPCTRSKMTGDWMCGCVVPASTKATPKVAGTRRIG